MHTVVELKNYQDEAESLLSSEERRHIIDYLAANPEAGEIMKGTGGIRKLRWRRGASGKSGGVQIIHFYKNPSMPLFLLTVYGKNQQENLSKADRNTMKQLVTLLERGWKKWQA
ncbi:hypothetical protein [Endozoicomonas sp. ALD040]|uniref:hypothetical protein n=1 Tax=unclassified Endozoicomonas TaxID=2644528 RepID=UPI003BAF60D2